jgi:1-phosphofructokinase family hexose kinase
MGTRSHAAFVAVATNPAIDRVARIDAAARGVVRASEFLETPGGKAIHAASVAAELRTNVAVITTAGGRSGDLLLALLASEPLEVSHVPVAGSTRGTYTVVGEGGEPIEVHEPSAPLTDLECDQLVAALAATSAPTVIAVSGSLPAGAPVDLHARLVATARGLGSFTILDCSSPTALAAALAEGPDLVAPNLAEAGALLGTELDSSASDAELAAVTDEIRGRGAAAVWLSLGPGGSVFADADGHTRVTVPAPERPINAVGCGDALIGGLAAGLAGAQGLTSAVALGAAAAADKLTHLHPGRVDRTAVEEIVSLVRISPLRTEAPV